MANIIPPIPFKTKMLKEDGYLTNPWKRFFVELWPRVGGDNAPPEGGADVLTNATDIADLKLRMEALEQEPVA